MLGQANKREQSGAWILILIIIIIMCLGWAGGTTDLYLHRRVCVSPQKDLVAVQRRVTAEPRPPVTVDENQHQLRSAAPPRFSSAAVNIL